MATETLIAVLDARTAKLDAKLKATDDKLDKFEVSTKKADKGLGKLSVSASALKTGLTATAVAVGAAVGAITSLTSITSAYAKEIKIASQLSGIAAEEIQLMAHATATVGIGLEKLGDISKDTLEKIGDYLNTGGGGFKDFADAMKLTKNETIAVANEFKTLSGPAVLQEMVNRMEAANVSSVQMSHALEGMASDTTNLLPLLMDSGRGMKALTESMASVVIPLSAADLEVFIKMEESSKKATEALKSLGHTLLLDLSDAFIAAADKASHFYASLNKGTEAQKTTRLVEIKDEIDALRETMENANTAGGRLWNTLTFNTQGNKTAQAEINELLKERIKIQKELTETGFGVVDPTAKEDSSEVVQPDVIPMVTEDIQKIADSFKEEEDLLLEKLNRDLEIIGENKELRLKLEDRYLNDLSDLEEAAESKKSKLIQDANDVRIKNSKKAHKMEQDLSKKNSASLLSIASSLAGGNEKIGKAIFLATQALGVADVFVQTQRASARALADLGPIAGAPVAAAIQTSGYISMGAIAATTLGSLSGGGGGGGFSGGSGGSQQSQPQQQQSFQPETSSLQITDSTDDGSTASTIRFATDSGDELMDTIAGLLNKGTEEGRYR